MAKTVSLYLFIVLLTCSTSALASYNIVNYGAKPDGHTDASKALVGAWQAACGARKPSSVTIPQGTFFVSQAVLQGPCNNNAVKIYIQGTLIAPSGYTSQTNWIELKYVQGVSIYGGALDGRGQAFWACKMAGRSCPQGATSLRIDMSKDVLISGTKLLNSENFNMIIFGSSMVTVQGAKITAPGNSPNTDGIHMQRSSGVTITGTTIMTGDDCVSMGEGTTNVWIERVNCGPGHGISIGSLGGSTGEAAVQNITATNVVFTGTQNGVRIKTWGKMNPGSVKDVTFEHIIMNNVQNPIVIDQNYCPGAVDCPNQSSGVKVTGIKYTDIRGSSATQVAMKFDCSPSNPCRGIGLQDIKLMYQNQQAQSFCRHVQGTNSGFVIPKSCI